MQREQAWSSLNPALWCLLCFHTQISHPTLSMTNSELTRSCTALPNVYIAHQPTRSVCHIHKDGVRKFAKFARKFPPGRNPTSSQPRSPPLPLPFPTLHAEQYAIHLLASVPQASPSITPSQGNSPAQPSPTKASHPPERHQSYAETVGQPTAAPKRPSELGEIKLLLHKLCAGLLRE